MATTQKAIAVRLGLSRSLVAQAIGGYPGVAETTRARILDEARRAGYEPGRSNREARSLAARRNGRAAKHNLLAVILPSTETVDLHQSPYFSSLLSGIEEEVRARQLDLFLYLWRVNSRSPDFINGGNLDGAIVLGAMPELMTQLAHSDVSALNLGAPHADLPALLPQSEQGAYLCARHLLELGHRRLAFLSHGLDVPEAAARHKGFVRALSEVNLTPRKEWVEASLYSPGDAAVAVGRLLACDPVERLTGLVCYNDAIAMHAVRALEAAGLRVPEDVSVTGFDDISHQHHFQPELTSVSYDREAMGRRAVQYLMDKLEEAQTPEADSGGWRETFPVELVVRQSSAPPGEV